MSFTLRFALDDRPSSALAAARSRAMDLRPALRAMGQAGVTQTRRRFITKRAPDGSSWKPTRKIGGTTMIDQGLLLRSLSARPPTQDAIEWGSNRVYAAQRQFGGTIRAKNGGYLRFRASGGGWVFKREVTQPGRAYLGLNREDEAQMEAILLRHVGEPLTGGSA